MNRYGKRCVLYPRVSTEMQVDGYSLEGQKNMLTRFADREEMIVVDTYEDAGKSGKSIEGRPAFQKMLRDIEDGLDIDYILVYKLSRFGRNAADILNSLELVQSYGVNLICIEEGIDSSQTSGKLLISVLSAVAEIERENIIEQTMNGRREKARQGGWNGGFAPYGYTREDNKLMIEETEAVAIRKIFELYTSSEIGLGGIANQLNLQGIRKIPRQNGTLEDWTGHFIKLILDNPVYCGKIAYGRRTKEKVKGTKNDYQMKRNDDYILTEGQHKGIVSEEVWEKAHAKRLRTGVKQPSKIGRDRVHLLSGLLKCPVCGSPMYTNKHAWTNKDGTYKEIYYYVCSRNRMVRGKHCEYKAMLKKTDIEPMVIEAIREIVRNEEYAQAIKKRIGIQIDTKAVDKELEGYQAKLKEVDLNKTRLEREIDSLPADAKYRERKLHDMTLRLDSLYDVIVELEEKIEDARLRRDAIKQQAITLENIYKIMVNFDCVYNIINDEEKRNVVTALIKEIEIYRNDESEYPLKRIGLNFPVFKDGGEVTELLWDKGNTVDAVVVGTYNPTDLMERSPVVPGSPYFMMTYDMAKNLTGITEQTGILAITVTPNHFDEVLSAVQEIAEQNGKISVNTIEQTIKNIEYRYSSSIKALYMAAAILFTFGGISLMNMLMVDFQNRKREFGLLEAVGATQKQLKAMLSREIGIYLGGSLTVSLVLGTIISIIACQRLEAVNHCITLNLPWLFLIALIAAMVVIYMIFTAYAKAELRKTGILSAIREE
ncbi:recombinase family protein [Phascolarctobacterium faecium]|uniref:recombinase family protein n=1 Tax=Phascolarctobacterium faecium TaxID=33025 RepID=UPI003AEF822B